MALLKALKPPVHRSMQTLDRAVFVRSLPVVAARVPVKSVGGLLKSVSKDLLNIPRMRNVTEDGDVKEKRLLLFRWDAGSKEELEEATREKVTEMGGEFLTHTVDLGYDYWTAEDILSAALPEDVEVPTSFETIGHIAHMNLRDEHLPHKHLIGQVILDKNVKIRTVVNKVDSIDTKFRFFKMEVLAGADEMEAEVRESNCRFQLDFSKVYWNSRLHTEHDRLVAEFGKGERVCDVFAGIGPFAVPAAKKGCIVHANDLNPESFKYLKGNKELNKISDANLVAYNLDGREFIREAFRNAPVSAVSPYRTFEHIVMNLPATALEFLDTFNGLLKDEPLPPKDMILPMVHCHCFSKREEVGGHEDIAVRVTEYLGHAIPQEDLKIHHVRSVAPNKDMYCASFRLTQEILYGKGEEGGMKRKTDEAVDEEVVAKTVKLE